MIDTIQSEISTRGISRLCHFTPSRSLAHILAGGEGVLPSRMLKEEDRLLFNPTDLRRLDGHVEHVCCSIEYPNAWYLDRARANQPLFPDWVVVFADPILLTLPGTLFCPRNAAAGFGAYIKPGYSGFSSMFKDSVSGAQGTVRRRTQAHLPCSPTDDQAEVLVSGSFPPASIIGIGVPSEEKARTEVFRLQLSGINVAGLNFVICPTMFNKHGLSAAIREGKRPDEISWQP